MRARALTPTLPRSLCGHALLRPCVILIEPLRPCRVIATAPCMCLSSARCGLLWWLAPRARDRRPRAQRDSRLGLIRKVYSVLSLQVRPHNFRRRASHSPSTTLTISVEQVERSGLLKVPAPQRTRRSSLARSAGRRFRPRAESRARARAWRWAQLEPSARATTTRASI